MKVSGRSTVGACAGAVVLAVAACGAPQEDPAPTRSDQGLAQIDPCTMVPSDVLASFGLREPGDPEGAGSSGPGCYFNGDKIAGIFYKNQEKTVESYGQQDNWAKFDRLEIDGRPAASAIDKGSTQARICSALFDSGGGLIKITVTEKRDQGIDECGEAVKIAETIAPRMPR
ncbi:DUF3558 domain-containing protein [Saccharopolyspora sp. NPDC000359]|uniref:DUF3558 domain-containing protein n=1 Tax=Saccharopolyspora sp. NPDC000359 TaxID=3154251 RepID=UPI003327135E